jgi:hypothetical protein
MTKIEVEPQFWFKVQGFWVQRFRVQGSGFKVQRFRGSRFKVQGSRFRGSRFRGIGCKV